MYNFSGRKPAGSAIAWQRNKAIPPDFTQNSVSKIWFGTGAQRLSFQHQPQYLFLAFSPDTLPQTWENFLSSFADLLLFLSPGTFIYWSVLNIAQSSSKVGRLNLNLCQLHPPTLSRKGPPSSKPAQEWFLILLFISLHPNLHKEIYVNICI